MILTVATALLVPSLYASWEADVSRLVELRRQAEQSEKRGDWLQASELYEQLLSKQRHLPDVKEHYLTCLRRAQQLRRHQDTTYRRQVAELNLTNALELYGELLNRLRAGYVDRDRTEVGQLFRQGLDELCFALEDSAFRRDFLPGVEPTTVRAFRNSLVPIWANRPLRRTADAQALVREIALTSHKTLGIKPVLVVLELASGACSGLDEYTLYIPPGQYAELCASLRGELVGVGLELLKEDEKLLVNQVLPGSSADLAGLKAGDRLVRLGKTPAARLSAEAATELLRGEASTEIEVQVLSGGETNPRTLRLVRSRVSVPSVSEPRFLGNRMAGIGYLQLVGFQETTLRELDEALAKLQMAGLQVLILDLRGNPGGLVEEAVHVAERFLPGGLIASTRGQLRGYNRTYEAQNPSALTLPLVVLIDGETSSAAELVAGALKDHDRATLVGQTTFGKGTIQRYWRLAEWRPTAVAAGFRLTVAKFYSPRGQPYQGQGVTPHVEVERSSLDWSMDLEQDPQIRAALETAARLAMGR